MKGKFTKIMAAMALLVGLTIPMGVWGQTRAEGDTHEFEQSLEQLLNNNALISSITIPVQSYSVKKVTISYRYNKTIQNAVTMEVTVGGTSWGTKYSTGTGSNYTTVDFEGTSATGAIVISFTNNTGSGTGHGTFYVNNVTLTEGPGGSFPTTYTVTYNANGGTGTMTDPNSPYEEGDEVTLLDNTFDAPEGMMWDSWLVKDAGNNTISVTNNQFTMPASNVNITAQWVADPNAPQYEWALTDLTDLTSSDVFVIVGTKGENTYAMSNATSSNCPEAITDVTVSGTRITSDVSEDMKWNIIVESNGYKFKPNGTEKYLAYGSSTTIHVGNYTSNNVFTYGVVDGNNYLQISSRYICVATSDWRAYALQNVSSNATNTLFYKRQVVSTDPAIYASNVNIAYNDLEGQIEYTLENEVTGGELTATTTSDWLTLPQTFASPITFTATENTMTEARTATVTLTYTYGNNQSISKDVTVTQGAHPVTYTTIEAMFDAAGNTATEVFVTFGGWVVSGVSTNGYNVFVTDGTNGFVINGGDHGFEVGNTLTSTTPITCTLQKSNGYAKVTGVNASTEGLTVGTGGTVTEADIEMANLTGINTGALVSYENLTCSVNNNKYYLSDGTTTLQVYNALFAFEDLEDGKTYNITGVYQQYNDTKEILPRSAEDIEELALPSITVTPATLNVEAGQYVVNDELILAYENIDVVNYESFTIQFYDAEGEEQGMPEWLVLGITGTNDEGYQVTGYISPNESEARSCYFKVYVGETYSNLVTVNQAAYVAPFEPATYTLATSIESGKTYIIVNPESNKAMGAQNENNRAAADVTIQDQTITVTSDAVYEFVIESVSEGIYCIYDDRAAGFLYAASSSSNYLRTKAELDDNGKWAISFNQDGVASIVAQGTNSRNVMQYNSGSTLFSCYVSASQKPVYLYVKEEETPEPETYELTINGYTDAESKAGYYLIASPVTVNIADVAGLTEGDFDLYSYDESQELEWINYKQEDGSHPFTTLEPGKGYLYAKKATAETSTYTFTLTGTPYYGTPIVLSKQSTGTLAGWNLIGNPLATSSIAPGRAFYIMNSTIGELIASESDTVEPMQGFFVIADEDGEEFELTVPLGGDGNLDKLVMNLSQNRGTVIDRAIVRFGEGEQLPKFQLFENSTKLYIPQGNSDYAIVRSAAEGEMPVNFKAKENGTYTISVNTEIVEMDYLHLIDNMTGNDVDLLATPSYTFEATTRDYASRFRLVFNANGNNAEGNANFAYFNGSEWQISNIGEATLQVVDVMGRIVKNVALEGNATVSINEMPGVYMMRLLNGNDVKVQKVVIR
jgi:hypothetical protein